MSGELSGRVAIVTGGASGIGAASAALLAEAGATVIVADVNEARASPGRFVAHDVTSDAAWKSLLDDVLAREGRLDIMVNNAGVSGGPGNPETTTVENWQQVQAINSEGVFLGCKYAIQGMKHLGAGKTAPGGSIVNISSIAGVMGVGTSIPYAASKGALNTLTLSLARWFGPAVRVNTVCPGFIQTRWLLGALGQENYEKLRDAQEETTPLRQAGTPEQMAEAVIFFLTSASNITGEFLIVDAGTHLGSLPMKGR